MVSVTSMAPGSMGYVGPFQGCWWVRGGQGMGWMEGEMFAVA